MNQLKYIVCLSVFLLLPTISRPFKLSLPQPDVLAVCRVTLKSGNIHEGFIFLGQSDYRNHNAIWMSGFLVGTRRHYFLTLDFLEFRQNQPNYVEIRRAKENRPKILKKPTGFLLWSPPSKLSGGTEIVDDDSGRNHYLVRNEQVEIKYEIFETLKLLQKLDGQLGLDKTSFKPEPPLLFVRDITRFELLRNPDPIWLDKIANDRKQFYKDFQDMSGDYVPPVWYHELHQNGDVDRYRRYQKNLMEFRIGF